MGYCKNITIDSFPKQGIQLGAVVDVCFRYDITKLIRGVVVRDDMEYPWETMIRLVDDRYVLASECQYTIVQAPPLSPNDQAPGARSVTLHAPVGRDGE